MPFISIGFAYGFRLITFKNPIRTTFSSPYSRYKNLLVDKKLDDISDRGGQYVSDDYTNMLTKVGIKISMCNEVHENARGRPVILKELME
jgi:hypothetical protein